MKPFDPKSKELEQLEDMEEDQLRLELGRCPGPIDLFSHEVSRKGFIKVGLGGLSAFVEARYHYVPGASDPTTGGAKSSTQFIPLSVGVTF